MQIITLVLISASYAIAQSIGTSLLDLEEDGRENITFIIPKYGYPVEKYDVITDDGYNLTLIRIPHGKSSNTTNSRPILLHHGIRMSADDWVITRPDKALSYILADAGYDVWLANCRGNKWSAKHVNISINEKAFWDYSWHEIAVYDVPAAIDFILATTGKQKIHYVGYSMGTTVFFVLMSERPEYNDKILTAGLLAPVGSLLYSKALIVKVGENLAEEAQQGSELAGKYFVPGGDNGTYSHIYCHDGMPTQPLCYLNFASSSGINPQEFNMTMLPLFFAHFPTTISWKTVVHYGQMARTGKFRQYDYGMQENIKRYNSSEPPSYNLSRVTVPVSVYHSDNDWMASPQDVAIVVAQLPKIVYNYRVPMASFSHIDFAYAIHVRPLLYDILIQQLNKY